MKITQTNRAASLLPTMQAQTPEASPPSKQETESVPSDAVELSKAEATTLPWAEMGKSAALGSVLATVPAVVSAVAGPQAGFAAASGLALGVGVGTGDFLKGIGTLVLGTYATRFGQGGLGTALAFSGVATAGFAGSPLYMPSFLEAATQQPKS